MTEPDDHTADAERKDVVEPESTPPPTTPPSTGAADATPPAASDPPAPPSAGAPTADPAGAESPNSEPTKPATDGDPKKRRRRRRKRKGEGAPARTDGEQQSKPREPRNPRDKRRSGKGSGPNRSRHNAMVAVRALSDMAQGLLDIEGVDLFGRPRFMELKLKVPIDSRRDGAKIADQVVKQILERVHEVREHDRALVPGAVYSYFHETSEAEGCRPTEPRQVFDGYGSTGRPQFSDFVTLAIERRDPGIDDLVNGEDVVVTHVTMGRVLRTQQLAEFGKASPVYRILGQVDAGLFPVLNASGKAAFSFQLLRGTTLEGQPRLRIHPVGATELTQLADPSVALTLTKFQQRLDAESLRLAGREANGDSPDADEEFALPLLQDLARQLVGRAKRKRRRTEHATQRADEGQRPTAKAYSDARTASDDQILADDSEGTVIVLGPRGRVHVFSSDARHVTSVMMAGSSIGKRRQQGRWQPAEPADRGEFRVQLRKRTEAGEDVAAQDAPPPTPEPPPKIEATPTAPPEAPPEPPSPAASGGEAPAEPS